MALPTIPHVVASGATLIASEMNENFDVIENALSDGNNDIAIKNLTLNGSCTVSGAATVNTAVMSGLLDVASDVSINTDTEFNGNVICPIFGFGAYRSIARTATILTPSQSYCTYDASGTANWMRSYTDAGGTKNLPIGTIVVVGVTSTGTLTINHGSNSNGTLVGFRLDQASITLDSVYDKLVLQLLPDPNDNIAPIQNYWYLVSFSKNG